jgi:carbohydrate-selective porin OprB
MRRTLSQQVLATAGVLCAIGLLSVLAGRASATVQQSISSPNPTAAGPSSSNTQSSIQGPLSPDQVGPISANPGATNIIPGTGLLGHLIGLDNIPGVRLGGLWIGNADYLFTGGVKPRTWSFNSLLLLNLNIDAEELMGIPGGSLDAELLQFNGENANGKAGVVIGYDGLTGPEAAGAHRAVRALVAAKPVREQPRDSSRQNSSHL